MKNSKQKTNLIIWICLLVVAWSFVAFILYHNRGDFTVEGILSFAPKNKLKAAMVMLALFALKSVDFLMYSGVLYTASGIMFPIGWALLLNISGMIIMSAIPYVIGMKVGVPLKESIERRYAKIKTAEKFYKGKDFLFTFALRILNIPIAAAGFLCGAAKLDFLKYLLASAAGMITDVIAFTVFGMGAKNQEFRYIIIAVGIKVLVFIVTLFIYRKSMLRSASDSSEVCEEKQISTETDTYRELKGTDRNET